jgi:hypothetical protein
LAVSLGVDGLCGEGEGLSGEGEGEGLIGERPGMGLKGEAECTTRLGVTLLFGVGVPSFAGDTDFFETGEAEAEGEISGSWSCRYLTRRLMYWASAIPSTAGGGGGGVGGVVSTAAAVVRIGVRACIGLPVGDAYADRELDRVLMFDSEVVMEDLVFPISFWRAAIRSRMELL